MYGHTKLTNSLYIFFRYQHAERFTFAQSAGQTPKCGEVTVEPLGEATQEAASFGCA